MRHRVATACRTMPVRVSRLRVEIFYLYPSEDTWSFGDREVCITYYPDGPRPAPSLNEPLAALERHFAAPAQPPRRGLPAESALTATVGEALGTLGTIPG